MGCGASKGAVVNSGEANIAGSDKRQRSGDKVREGRTTKADTSLKEREADMKVSDLTPVEFVDRIMQITSVDGQSNKEFVDETIKKESQNVISKKSESNNLSVTKLGLIKSDVQKFEAQSEIGISNSKFKKLESENLSSKLESKCPGDGPPSSNVVNDEDALLAAAEHLKREDTNGTQESSKKKESSELETEEQHTKELIVSGSSEASSSSRGRFAAFEVPVSTDSKPLQHKFSESKSDKMDEGELLEKLQEKQRAAAARKEEELKKRARASGRVSMKDRLRKEIMESRRQDEEAGLLDSEEIEEEETGIPDEIEKDTYFNEPTQVDEF